MGIKLARVPKMDATFSQTLITSDVKIFRGVVPLVSARGVVVGLGI